MLVRGGKSERISPIRTLNKDRVNEEAKELDS